MIQTFAALVLFIAAVQAENITFNNCGKAGTIYWIDVAPCDSEPCTFKHGQVVTVAGELITNALSTQPKLNVKFKLLGKWIKFSGFNTDACRYLTCPIQPDTLTPFAITINFTKKVPSIKTTVQFAVNDGDYQLACAQTKMKIK